MEPVEAEVGPVEVPGKGSILVLAHPHHCYSIVWTLRICKRYAVLPELKNSVNRIPSDTVGCCRITVDAGLWLAAAFDNK